MRPFALHLAALLVAPQLFAQAPPDSGSAGEALRVFIDCQQLRCDLDFFRTEIAWVSYVRDRAVADVHVLITRQGTGGGGNEHTLTFLGQRAFAGMSDTLRYVAPPAAADDAVRRGLGGMLKLGLARFAARTELASRVRVTVDTAGTQARPSGPLRDPWDFWVVRTRANGFFNGQRQSRSVNAYSEVTASRVTAAWKTIFGVNGSYGEDRFTFNDGRQFRSYQHSYGADALIVKSLTDHWSTGMTASAAASTFLNQRMAVSVAPAMEYNYFPYSQSTRRELIARYALGVRAFRYNEQTLFDRTSETRAYHEIVVGLDARQPWGSISTTASGSQYFFDPNRFSLNLFNRAEVRLVKGLSINISGAVSLVRDQLHIPKVGATDEEVLLQRRQLETSYRYFASAGLSYTFGSIYNNIVNPRFGGDGNFFFF